MKALAVILSLYIFVLATLPCVDRPIEKALHQSELSSGDASRHEHDADHCSRARCRVPLRPERPDRHISQALPSISAYGTRPYDVRVDRLAVQFKAGLSVSRCFYFMRYLMRKLSHGLLLSLLIISAHAQNRVEDFWKKQA